MMSDLIRIIEHTEGDIMAKWAVIYSSVTGNTEKVAKTLAASLENADCFKVDDAPEDVSGYDGLAVGYWLWRGGPDKKMLDFMAGLEGKKVFLFATHSAKKSSEHAVTSMARGAASLGRGCTILATFECQGELAPASVERRRRMAADDPHAKTGGWVTAFGHPDENDLAEAAETAKTAMRKLAYFMKKDEEEKELL